MSDIWEAGSDVREMIQGLVTEHHPDLAVVLDKIAVLFKEKSSKSGGVVIPGKAKKAPKALEILGRKPFIFLLEIGADEWQTYSNNQRLALLDHLLCACKVKFDEDSGNIKYFIAPPDFRFFKDEIIRHGVWQDLGEGSDSDQVVIQLEESLGETSE